MRIPWALGLVLAATGAMAGPRVEGPVETVFSWQDDRCARWHVPDTPARVWQGADGMVHLLAGAEQNRWMRGAGLDDLRVDCTVRLEGAGSADPGAYDDRSWIASVLPRADGRVEALVHEEYHGDTHPGACASEVPADCWRNAISQAELAPGAPRFRRTGLVATLPYRYDGSVGRRTGYFNPSNILRDGPYVYAFIWAEAYQAQKRGACLLRRPIDGGAGDWRAWDGSDFTRRFVDPYREDIVDPAAHVCEPVDQGAGVISSLVRQGETGPFLAASPVSKQGIVAMLSDDLLRWGPPVPLWPAPIAWARDCSAPFAYAYPSLVDGEVGPPRFDRVGERFWLYVTRMRLTPDCGLGPDRDLVRMPVSWPPRAAAGRVRPEAAPDPRDPRATASDR